jgi:hypothetical protein
MVKAGLALILAAAPAGAGEPASLAAWAAGLPPHYAAHGVKLEPTYEEAVDLSRDGDLFVAVGGAPGWARRLREAVEVAPDGAARRAPCGASEDCRVARPPGGFLAGAALLGALRRGALAGPLATTRYGRFELVCVDARALGVAEPILDPCFERRTGAPLAQRHRLNGAFDGPSLDPERVTFE